MSTEIVNEFGDRRDLLGESDFDVSHRMQSGLAEMGIRAEFANPATRTELKYSKSAAFEAPQSLVGPGKYRESLPANVFREGLPFSSVDLLVNRPGIADSTLRTDFEIESARLEASDQELVAAARGMVAIHDTYAIMQITAKTESVFGIMGRKEENPIPLVPDAIADVLEHDSKIADAFMYYLRASGFDIDVEDIVGIAGDEVKIQAEIAVEKKGWFGAKGKADTTRGGGLKDKTLKLIVGEREVEEKDGTKRMESILGKELLDHTLTRAELVEFRSRVQDRFGKAEESVAFALASVMGLFCLGPRARREFITPEGGKDEIKDLYLWKTTNPLFIGHARTVMESKWVGSEAQSFIESAGVNLGAKRKCTLADVIQYGSLGGAFAKEGIPSYDFMSEIIAALRNMPESAVKGFWKKMNGLRILHDGLKTIKLGYTPEGKVANASTFTGSDIRGILFGAVDSLVIGKETAIMVGNDFNLTLNDTHFPE